MKITAIRQPAGTRRSVTVEIGERRLKLSPSAAAEAGLHVGDELDAATLARLEGLEVAARCREMALNLLAHRPRTEKELTERLIRRTIPPHIVQSCLVDLRHAGLLDDEAVGLAMASDRFRLRPVGRRRMVDELRSRGVDRDVSEAVVGRAMEEAELSEEELARSATRRFRRRDGEDSQRARRRLYGLLARRGFSSEVIRPLLEELVSDD